VWHTWCGSSFLERKEKIESQPDGRLLIVRVLVGVVVMLIISVEFDVFAYRKQATRIERGSAPFAVLALVKWLGSDVRAKVIGAD
jgi:hypothetical protein